MFFSIIKFLYRNIEKAKFIGNWYNNDRAHSGKHCYGKTPMKTWNDSKQLAKSKNLGNMFKKSNTISNENNHS